MKFILQLLFGVHRWDYYNPFNRTCERCGRDEVQFGWAWMPLWKGGWWEVFNDGDGRCQ